jgi:hypothetical protein
MHRSYRPLALLGSVLLLGANCTPKPAEQVFTIKLRTDKTSLAADTVEAAKLTVDVTVDTGTLSDRKVDLTVTAGGLLFPDGAFTDADGGVRTGETSLTVNLSARGSGVAQLKCLDVNARPVVGTPRVTAVYKTGEKTETAALTLTCNSVVDKSAISFVAPLEGDTVNASDRQMVTLRVKDYNDFGATRTGAVVITPVAPQFIQLAATSDGSPELAGDPITLDARQGDARFYVLYPGDNRTLAGPIAITLKAEFVSLIGGAFTATRTFNYERAPNNSSISFIGATRSEGGTAHVHEAIPPLMVDMNAGAAGSNESVFLKVWIKNRAGAPPPADTKVVFSCALAAGTSDPDNCRGFTAYSLFDDGGTNMEEGLTTGYVRSIIEPRTGDTPERGVAIIEYRPNAGSTAGSVRIGATFSPDRVAETGVPEGDKAMINLVQADTLVVYPSATPEVIDSSLGQTSEISVAVRRGTSPVNARTVCWSLDAASATRARLAIGSFDTSRHGTIVSGTDSNGVTRGTLITTGPTVRGPVRIQVVVVDRAYTPGVVACPEGPETRITRIQQVQVTRPSILQSLVFMSATPPVLGAIGSSLPTTSQVVFLLTNDDNQPEIGQTVTFALDPNGDPAAQVTPVANTDGTGNVTCFVSAGQQAATLVVRATAMRGSEIVTAASAPIAVVGGRPAWAPMHIYSQHDTVWAPQSTGGYVDPFGPQDHPQSTNISVVLVDRFSNRVAPGPSGSGYQVQFRAETGHIQSTAETGEDGSVSVPYTPGPAYTADVLPSGVETREIVRYRYSHLMAPQDVFRVANPRDGEVDILVATRGEESFIDANGDGAFQRAFYDGNGNGRYDGRSEDCNDRWFGHACVQRDCDTIENVPSALSSYRDHPELVETFVDLPEPFLDRNHDGLRDNCDLDVKYLPLHNDQERQALGIGTYCNPFFDNGYDSHMIAENPDTGLPFTAAECREHWCPDWDPQWNCSDSEVGDDGRPTRTPVAIYDSAPNQAYIVGGRLRWCPTWRYKELVGADVSGIKIARNQVLPGSGIRALMPSDAATVGTGTLKIWNHGGLASMAYMAPSQTVFGTPVSIAECFEHFACALQGSSINPADESKWLYVEIGNKDEAVNTAMTSGVDGRQWQITIRNSGEQRAPFSDFDRNQLRVSQSDQFIDGNNNGRWDDANGCYDTDTLIFKYLTLDGVGDVYFNGYDWREAPPAVWNHEYALDLGIDNLKDRLHSFMHVVPNGAGDSVDSTIPQGGGDHFCVVAGSGQGFRVRFADVNGNWVVPYRNEKLYVSTDGMAPNGEAMVISPDALVSGTGIDLTDAEQGWDFSVIVGATPEKVCAEPHVCKGGVTVAAKWTYDTTAGRLVAVLAGTSGHVYASCSDCQTLIAAECQ